MLNENFFVKSITGLGRFAVFAVVRRTHGFTLLVTLKLTLSARLLEFPFAGNMLVTEDRLGLTSIKPVVVLEFFGSRNKTVPFAVPLANVSKSVNGNSKS